MPAPIDNPASLGHHLQYAYLPFHTFRLQLIVIDDLDIKCANGKRDYASDKASQYEPVPTLEKWCPCCRCSLGRH
jgi:hypothetical protein